jgi:hypothetical protein
MNMGYEDRKELQLNIDDILENNFLIADFMLVPDLRERLQNAKLEEFSKLLEHFDDKKNVEAFANVLSHNYKDYLESKSKRTFNLDLMIDTLLEITGLGKYAIVLEAVYHLFYNYDKQDNAVEKFHKALKGYRVEGVLDLSVYSPERFNERDKGLIERGKNEIQHNAIRVLSGLEISAEVVAEALKMTVEEVKEVLKH